MTTGKPALDRDHRRELEMFCLGFGGVSRQIPKRRFVDRPRQFVKERVAPGSAKPLMDLRNRLPQRRSRDGELNILQTVVSTEPLTLAVRCTVVEEMVKPHG